LAAPLNWLRLQRGWKPDRFSFCPGSIRLSIEDEFAGCWRERVSGVGPWLIEFDDELTIMLAPL